MATKGKDGRSLFEVLKGPLGGKDVMPKASPLPPPPVPTPSETTPSPVDVATPSPTIKTLPPSTVVTPPSPSAAEGGYPTPRPATSAPMFGETAIHLTYTTAMFILIIFFMLLLLAYVLGVQKGKTQVMPHRTSELTVPTKFWTIRVGHYPSETVNEKKTTEEIVQRVTKVLEGAGLTQIRVVRGESEFVVYCGKFKDRASSEAMRAFEKVTKFKLDRHIKDYFSPQWIQLSE